MAIVLQWSCCANLRRPDCPRAVTSRCCCWGRRSFRYQHRCYHVFQEGFNFADALISVLLDGSHVALEERELLIYLYNAVTESGENLANLRFGPSSCSFWLISDCPLFSRSFRIARLNHGDFHWLGSGRLIIRIVLLSHGDIHWLGSGRLLASHGRLPITAPLNISNFCHELTIVFSIISFLRSSCASLLLPLSCSGGEPRVTFSGVPRTRSAQVGRYSSR